MFKSIKPAHGNTISFKGVSYIYTLCFVLAILLSSCGGENVAITKPIKTLPLAKVLPELSSLGIQLSNTFTDAEGIYTYSVSANTKPSVATASIDNSSNAFNINFLNIGSTDISITENHANTSATLVLRVTISEPASVSQNVLDVQNTLADVSIALVNSFPVSNGLTYAVGSNSNPEVVTANLSNNTLNLDFLGSGITTITLVESNASGTTGLVGEFTLTATSNDPCVPDNTVGACDRDSDNLTNAQEAALGTDPTKADTDEDDVNDGDEVGSDIENPKDTDNDGKIDALESSKADSDNDGTVDQEDSDDSDPCMPDANAENCNKISVAKNQAVTTDEDKAIDIVIMADDANEDPLTYSVVADPSNGTLTGEAPNLTYTPVKDFSGQDTFTFKANDGKEDSNIATVTITVNQINDAPVAANQNLVLDEDTIETILFTATDIENDTLTYSIVSGPTNGNLTGTVPNLIYTPNANYAGSDSFTFKANDGELDSEPATVELTVNAVNDAPVATNQSLALNEDTAKAILLTATDIEDDTLTYSIVSGPTNGNLTGTVPNLIYTPNANYAGTDSFTFKANDGELDSEPATVELTVNAVNDAPVATNQSLALDEDTAKAIPLTATDVEGDSLTYSVVTGPTNGNLTGTAPNLTYTPNANYAGTDSFTFKVNDGELDSEPATVEITINAINDTPIAENQSLTLNEGTSVPVLLTATDIEGNTLTYSVVSGPMNGNLSGTAPNLTYTPNANYSGSDSFTFKANDGTVDSEPATVSITVLAIPKTGIVPESSTCASTAVNDTCTVTILLQDNNQTINGFGFRLKANPDYFTISSATEGSLLPEGCSVASRTDRNAIVGFCIDTSFGGNGELAIVTMQRIQAGNTMFETTEATISVLSGALTPIVGSSLTLTTP